MRSSLRSRMQFSKIEHRLLSPSSPRGLSPARPPSFSPFSTHLTHGVLVFNHPHLVSAKQATKQAIIYHSFPLRSVCEPFSSSHPLCPLRFHSARSYSFENAASTHTFFNPSILNSRIDQPFMLQYRKPEQLINVCGCESK